jgi:ATP-dependent DNA helicase DinG
MSSSLREAGHGLRSLLETLEGELSILADQSEGIRSLADRTRSGQRELSFLLEEGTQGYVSWYEVRGHGVFLQTTPLDVSGHLRGRFFNKGLPIILTSATLSVEGSFDYLKRGLGLKNTDELLLDSPFDFKRQLLLYLPSQMAHPRSDHFVEWASEEILRILRRSHGRAFVLTTSHRHMEELYKRCKERTALPLLKQGNKPRHRLLQEFQGVVSSVLFATASFWQGVDVQGDSLSCVIIVKLPFASPTDPITAGKIEYLREQGEDPFQVYQLPKAVIQLKQGVGRLIRTARDRGVIALLDRRLLEQSYGARFLKSLPPAPLTQDEAEIERFLFRTGKADH